MSVVKLDWDTLTVEEQKHAMGVVEGVLWGGDYLDRKKSEIKRVVGSLVGLLNASSPIASDPHVFRAQGFEWWVIAFKPGDVQIEARARERGVGSAVFSSGKSDDISHRHIELVRGHLPMLAFGLLLAYPNLDGLIRPILDAYNTHAAYLHPVGAFRRLS